MAIKITKGSGNIFRDLGYAPVEAEHLRVRAGLMLVLEQLIAHRRLTQAQAAKLLGVSQPRVNDLVRGRLHRFSIDAARRHADAGGCPRALHYGARNTSGLTASTVCKPAAALRASVPRVPVAPPRASQR
jgi:predicted XRE-type DNA-binding protein